MGLFDFFFGGKETPESLPAMPPGFSIDLQTFSCGRSRLGSTVEPADYYSSGLHSKDTCEDKRFGIEVGTRAGVLDYVFVTCGGYPGGYCRAGEKLPINATTNVEEILELFGEPYWTDRSDGEVILFYEYEQGTVELQFEFTDGQTLNFITLARDGVLSSAEQRKAYGVTKSWPC
jgi:hypothetical protein